MMYTSDYRPIVLDKPQHPVCEISALQAGDWCIAAVGGNADLRGGRLYYVTSNSQGVHTVSVGLQANGEVRVGVDRWNGDLPVVRVATPAIVDGKLHTSRL